MRTGLVGDHFLSTPVQEKELPLAVSVECVATLSMFHTRFYGNPSIFKSLLRAARNFTDNAFALDPVTPYRSILIVLDPIGFACHTSECFLPIGTVDSLVEATSSRKTNETVVAPILDFPDHTHPDSSSNFSNNRRSVIREPDPRTA